MRNTSTGSSKTIPNPPKKQQKSKPIIPSGSSSNSCSHFFQQILLLSFCMFSSFVYPLFYISSVLSILCSYISSAPICPLPLLSISSLYLFLKINLYNNHSKRYKLPPNSFIINICPLLACIFSPLACIFFLKNDHSKRYKLIRNTTRREKKLRDKIDYAKYLTWFIENYPSPAKETKTNQQNEAFWQQFK